MEIEMKAAYRIVRSRFVLIKGFIEHDPIQLNQ